MDSLTNRSQAVKKHCGNPDTADKSNNTREKEVTPDPQLLTGAAGYCISTSTETTASVSKIHKCKLKFDDPAYLYYTEGFVPELSKGDVEEILNAIPHGKLTCFYDAVSSLITGDHFSTSGTITLTVEQIQPLARMHFCIDQVFYPIRDSEELIINLHEEVCEQLNDKEKSRLNDVFYKWHRFCPVKFPYGAYKHGFIEYIFENSMCNEFRFNEESYEACRESFKQEADFLKLLNCLIFDNCSDSEKIETLKTACACVDEDPSFAEVLKRLDDLRGEGFQSARRSYNEAVKE